VRNLVQSDIIDELTASGMVRVAKGTDPFIVRGGGSLPKISWLELEVDKTEHDEVTA
jgi:hypothetical protein